jgi:hypothetical protein
MRSTRLQLVPVVGDARPIVGVKLAHVVAVGSALSFAPAYPRVASLPYTAVAKAVCESDDAHAAPSLTCHCGFHAVPTRRELWRLAPTTATVVLDVELAGTVIEHRRGWRAAHQAVLGVRLPPTCARMFCRRPTVGLAPYHPRRFDLAAWPWTPLRAVCARCGTRNGIGIADIASALRVEVRADDTTADDAHDGGACDSPASTARTSRRLGLTGSIAASLLPFANVPPGAFSDPSRRPPS